MLCRASSFTFEHLLYCCIQLRFQKKVISPACSLQSEFADTLAASRPEDAFTDLIANSVLSYQSSNNVINSGQNCILQPVFNCINNFAHFSVNSFIKTTFQSFHIHCISSNN